MHPTTFSISPYRASDPAAPTTPSSGVALPARAQPVWSEASHPPISRVFALALAALCLGALAAGCEEGDALPRPRPRDAGADAPSDAAAGPCEPGRLYCRGNESYECGPDGRPVNEQTCGGATPTCAPDIGCTVCNPSARQCDPSNPMATQACAPDGSRWLAGATCDAAMGERCNGGACTSPCAEAAAQRSYLGCEYWPVTLLNGRPDRTGDFPFAIAVANPQTTQVSVTIEGGALTAPVTRTVAPGALETIELPWVRQIAGLADVSLSVLHARGAYHVRTTAPVTVYQFNPLVFQSRSGQPSYSNDASLLLPTPVLGRRYTNLTYTNWGFGGGHLSGYLAVVAAAESETGTTVTVRLSDNVMAGTGVAAGAMGSTQTYTLRRGDVLLLSGEGAGDMTASTVEASAPVAVYAGHTGTQVAHGREAADHLEEQLFPEEAWGRRYAVTPFVDRPGVPTSVRILALRDNTQITFDPPSAGAAATLGARRFVELQTSTDFVVSANEPILVMQYMQGQGSTTSGAGDPAMVLAVPIEQFRTEYTFLTPATYTRNFVSIVGMSGAPPTLDGRAVTAAARALGGSGLSVWNVELAPGVHRVGTPGATAQWGINVYGTAPYTSYAYPGGLDLRVINPG